MLKQQAVREASRGLLHLYDNEFSGWDRMSDQHRLDWLCFFDICKEDSPTIYTEPIAQAVMTRGLCPHKKKVCKWNDKWGHPGEASIAYETIWCFKQGKEFSAGSLPEIPKCPVKHYLCSSPFGGYYQSQCLWIQSIDKYYGSRGNRQKKLRKENAVHKFDHMAKAWEFLFKLM